MSHPKLISVRGFRKAYDNHVAVNGLSFEIDGGQVLGLIGPNGAGKTTSLKAIAAILPASGGSITVGGFDVDCDPISVKKQAAYVPDDPQLFNDLTVEQHLAFTASVYDVVDWSSEAHSILDKFDLLPKLNCRAAELSRGMRQKLAVACAYLFRPKAILLDEPMTGLDPKGIRVLKESILERASRGDAIVISSHLLAMVEDICTDVLILQAGESRFFDSLTVLREKFGQDDNSSLEEIFFNAVAH